jgi:hypothetical protein
MSSEELKCVRKWLDKNLEKSFIRKSKARCAAPLLLTVKSGGGMRIYQNYKGLNNIIIKNRYLLPLIREILNSICRAKYYIKLNIIAAFNNIRIAKGHEWKTAFITRFELFETLVMLFGLYNFSANFQNYVNNIFWNALNKYAIAYLNNVLIYSELQFNYRKHV